MHVKGKECQENKVFTIDEKAWQILDFDVSVIFLINLINCQKEGLIIFPCRAVLGWPLHMAGW